MTGVGAAARGPGRGNFFLNAPKERWHGLRVVAGHARLAVGGGGGSACGWRRARSIPRGLAVACGAGGEPGHHGRWAAGDGDERGLQAPDGVEHCDVRAGGGHQEEPERGAADLDALPQRFGHAGQPDRPCRPHHRRAPARPVHVRSVVTMAVAVVTMAVVVAAAPVRAGGEEHGSARVEEQRSRGQGEEIGRGAAAVAEVREGWEWEAEEARGRRHRRSGDRGEWRGCGNELHCGGGLRLVAEKEGGERSTERDRVGEGGALVDWW
ncbi:hypothetical protein SETIT_4G252900v2 [Setaria italica]|uniref:Uncharacterized protein n=1 Tax=Setaria italica TaxID=4555 RepID=A0A368QYH4_SETIT|nr:hypothetical protein SETIT_4G252900v2 [Setaria italica]